MKTVTVTKYQCDVCGKEFDSELECYVHEHDHEISYPFKDSEYLVRDLKYLADVSYSYSRGGEVLGMKTVNFKSLMLEAARRLGGNDGEES